MRQRGLTAVQIFRLIEIAIVSNLMLNINGDQKNTGNPEGQTCHIDDGVKFILEEVSKSDLEIVQKHIDFFVQAGCVSQ